MINIDRRTKLWRIVSTQVVQIRGNEQTWWRGTGRAMGRVQELRIIGVGWQGLRAEVEGCVAGA